MTGKDTKFIVDASVAVKWFSIEEHTPQARSLLNQIIEGGALAYAPDLLLQETINALWKGKGFDKERLTASLEILWNSGVKFERLNMPLAQTATGFMVKYNITFYDAIYAALAFTLQIPLLSYDSKGHKKIKEIEVIEL